MDPADIKTWNNLRRNAVRTGQVLRIQTRGDVADNSQQKGRTASSNRVSAKEGSSRPAAVASNSREASQQQATTSTYSKKSKKQKQAEEKQLRKDKEKDKKDKKNKKKKKKEETRPTSHQLKNGDNLSTLSKKYGVSVEEIKKANNMKNDNLRAGESIKIPSKNAKSGKKDSKSKKKGKKSKKRK